jgi:cytochrome c-type biogenesis protein CcmH
MRRAAAFSNALGAAALSAAALCIGGLCVGGAMLAADTARALDAYGQIEDPALQARYEHIIQQLRCLVCQNESIADSNVELASDLRRQVREMLIAGKSDDAIFAFMTDRYGEFVRFNPPLEPKTLLIWGAPFIMLLVGVGIIYRVVRQRSRLPLDDEPASGPM